MIAKRNQLFKLTGAILASAVISACSSDNTGASLNSGTASSGDADVSEFVSIGDSLTAGYADGALYLLGQTNSFPNILAQQFADADGVAVDFEQPLATTDLGGFLVGGMTGVLENRFVLDAETQTPERLAGDPTEEVIGSGLNGMTFNNMGVPGAKSFHLIAPGYGDPGPGPGSFIGVSSSPYYVRFAVDPVTSSVVSDAAAQAPSFYTLWIGNNDVLGFATTGGDDSDPITDTATFDFAYGTIVDAMTAANPAVQGVLINIPDVSTIPFFTTVPFNAVPLEDQADVDALNGAYADYNSGLDLAVAGMVITAEEAAQRKIVFALGQNAMVILDETLTPIGGPETFLRQTTADDLIVLTASTAIQTAGGGTSAPLTDADVLIPSEIEAIETARTAFNATIKAAADADPNLAFFDAAAVMAELKESGISFNTGSVSSDFATGGAFSLDGVHPTGRGYAVIANEIIDVINEAFNANVHKVDPAGFPTIFLK